MNSGTMNSGTMNSMDTTDSVESENDSAAVPVNELEGTPENSPKQARFTTVAARLGAAGWGFLVAIRALALLFIVSAIVIAPIVIFDEGSEVRSASILDAILDASTWGMLVINGIPPQLGAATFTLIPWGLAIATWLLLYYSARSLARRFTDNVPNTITSLLLFGIAYSGLVIAAAIVARSINVSFGLGYTIGVVLVMSVTSVAAALLTVYGHRIHLPELMRFILIRGLAAVFALFGVGALLVALSMIVNFADLMTLFSQLDPGYSGFLGITLLSIGYLPVLAVWALSYAVGAGISIGPDVMISPFIPVTAPTQLPPFPPLAILPEQASAGSWLLPVLVIAVGVVWGIGVSLRQSKENPLMRLVIAMAISIVAALLTMVVAVLSLGDLGDVRLVELGPTPTLVGSLTWLLLSVGMIPAAMIPARVFKRSRRRPQISVVSE